MAVAFDAAMRGFEPFAAPPHLAVAVSGGADSLALCLLAHDWVARRGGRVTALSVDHGLRRESAAEVAAVAAWLAGRGIAHRRLPWRGDKPATAIQEAARAARYRLLLGWCREAGVAHLLLGHHRRDQAETVLLRLLRGSGIYGLAGMAGLLETTHVRLLRPLLGCDSSRLRAFLRERGQDWIEDPSNDDRRFTRSRLRAVLASPAVGAAVTDALLDTAAAAAAARAAMQDAVIAFVARSCTVHAAGYARIDRDALAAAPREVGVRLLAAIMAMIGGAAHECSSEPVRRARIRLLAAADAATTLGRCRLLVRDGQLVVFRERRGLPSPRPLVPGDDLLWDGRFRVTVPAASAASRVPALLLRPLDTADWRIVRADVTTTIEPAVPHLARITLPVLCDEQGLRMAPLLGYTRAGCGTTQSEVAKVSWTPRKGITGAGYFLA